MTLFRYNVLDGTKVVKSDTLDEIDEVAALQAAFVALKIFTVLQRHLSITLSISLFGQNGDIYARLNCCSDGSITVDQGLRRQSNMRFSGGDYGQ